MDNGDETGAPPTTPTSTTPPEDPTAISASDRDKIAATLNSKVANAAMCTCCGKPGMQLAPHYVTPTVVQPNGSFFMGGTTYPQIMLVCTNCGFTRYHNAVALGAFNES